MHIEIVKLVFWTTRDRGHVVGDISARPRGELRATLFEWQAQGGNSPVRQRPREPRKLGAFAVALNERLQQDLTISLGQATSRLRQVHGDRANTSDF